MGNHWLSWAPDYLRAEGLNVRTWSGWETRSRSSGGLDAILGIVIHHTVSTTTLDNDARYCWEAATDRPIGNWLLDRSGTWLMGVAGASNTNGKGGPRVVSQGVIPLDDSNRNCPAVEACNNGIGEPWPDVQLDSYVRGVAAIIKGVNAETPFRLVAGDVHAHSEWAPTRKTDPAGPCRFAPSGGTWHLAIGPGGLSGMDLFRGEVFAALLEEDDLSAAADEILARLDVLEAASKQQGDRVVERINTLGQNEKDRFGRLVERLDGIQERLADLPGWRKWASGFRKLAETVDVDPPPPA